MLETTASPAGRTRVVEVDIHHAHRGIYASGLTGHAPHPHPADAF